MKTISILILIIACCFQGFSKNPCSSPSSFPNDIELVKPLINTNGPDGGYYQEYWGSAFHYLLCGAVIKNSGTSVANHVFLEMKIYDYTGFLQSYFSDTVASMNPGESVTVNIPDQLTFEPWITSTRILESHFIARSDAIDEDPGNNEQIVPFTELSDWIWTIVSRSVNPEKSFEVGENSGFHSGDFIGFTFNHDQEWWHWLYNMKFYLYEPCDSLVIRAMLYLNGNPYDSANILLFPPPSTGEWQYSDPFFYPNIYNDSSYFAGIKFYFPEGKSFKIGIDTSLYHNFSSESIGRVNNEWTSLPFIPVMQVICDPEGITEKDPFKPVVFPNPAGERITVDNVRGSEVELFDFSGKILFSGKVSSQTMEMDVSGYAPGIYLLRIIRQDGVITRKVIIE